MRDSKINDFFAELEKRADGELRDDEYSRLLYSTDASMYQVMPHGVFFPKHTDDIQAALELAHKFKVPVLPRTAGTSLAGQAVNEALIIDVTRHVDSVLEINSEEKWVRVQPGIVLDNLNSILKPHRLKFGPDPASANRAGMGGIVGNNSTGSHSILYGMTADHVLETGGVLSDGSLFHFKSLSEDLLRQKSAGSNLESQIHRQIKELASSPENQSVIAANTAKHWRRCGGYNLDRFIDSDLAYGYPQRDKDFNLARLICGSEGTLGVMSEIKLGLVDLPKSSGLALLMFDELKSALAAVPTILEASPSAIELIDHVSLRMCRQMPELARLLRSFADDSVYCILATEFYGESDSQIQHSTEVLRKKLKNAGIRCEFKPLKDPRLMQNVWSVRKAGLGLLMSVRGDYKPLPFIEDSAVPPEKLVEYVSGIEKFCNDLGTDLIYYAHASAGCLHIRPMINVKLGSEVEKLPKISRFAVDMITQYGGVVSSEHGDGKARSWLNEAFYGPELYALFQQVKQTFDPHNLLNPGNVVNAPPMTENLRYGDSYQSIEMNTHFDFSDQEGFDRAVEMCNGAGVCRKLQGGTMCPSFMATRDEAQSTRGRANALRGVLSGRLDASEFTSERMYQVMELCVGCKGCKAECPSSVDMARIKAEFLAAYNARNGLSLRSRIFGNIATLSRLNSGWRAPLANLGVKPGVIKWLLEKTLGISSKRKLPEFASQTYLHWYHKRKKPVGLSRQVVLFHDTFNTYNDPHIAIAATEILEAAGYEVLLPGHRCCGRPMISLGMLEDAKALAADTVARLEGFAREGLPIVGLEPSCLLTLRDEYLHLLPDSDAAKIVAKQSFLFDEFFQQMQQEGHLPEFVETETESLHVHGHCHQKALCGMGEQLNMLQASGYNCTLIGSGCCGMAGAFGYEAEHVDVSLQMGELTLLPEVRNLEPDGLIAASGTSCRHQIADGADRKALHPVELVRRRIKHKEN